MFLPPRLRHFQGAVPPFRYTRLKQSFGGTRLTGSHSNTVGLPDPSSLAETTNLPPPKFYLRTAASRRPLGREAPPARGCPAGMSPLSPLPCPAPRSSGAPGRRRTAPLPPAGPRRPLSRPPRPAAGLFACSRARPPARPPRLTARGRAPRRLWAAAACGAAAGCGAGDGSGSACRPGPGAGLLREAGERRAAPPAPRPAGAAGGTGTAPSLTPPSLTAPGPPTRLGGGARQPAGSPPSPPRRRAGSSSRAARRRPERSPAPRGCPRRPLGSAPGPRGGPSAAAGETRPSLSLGAGGPQRRPPVRGTERIQMPAALRLLSGSSLPVTGSLLRRDVNFYREVPRNPSHQLSSRLKLYSLRRRLVEAGFIPLEIQLIP